MRRRSSARQTQAGTPARRPTTTLVLEANAVVAEAGRQLRAPAAAAVAGVLFAIMYTAGLVLLRSEQMYVADDAELVRLFARGEDLSAVDRRPLPRAVRRRDVPVVRRRHPGPDRRSRGPLLRDGLLRQRHPVRRPAVRRVGDRRLAERQLPLPRPAGDVGGGDRRASGARVHRDLRVREPRRRRLPDRDSDDRPQDRRLPALVLGDQLRARRRPADRRHVPGLGDPRPARLGPRRERLHPPAGAVAGRAA